MIGLKNADLEEHTHFVITPLHEITLALCLSGQTSFLRQAVSRPSSLPRSSGLFIQVSYAYDRSAVLGGST